MTVLFTFDPPSLSSAITDIEMSPLVLLTVYIGRELSPLKKLVALVCPCQ